MGNEELAKRIEAGEKSLDMTIGDKMVFGERLSIDFGLAINGSLDQAKALHESVMPEAWYCLDGHCVGQIGQFSAIVMEHIEGGRSHQGHAKTPAAAWVAAILRAKSSVCEPDEAECPKCGETMPKDFRWDTECGHTNCAMTPKARAAQSVSGEPSGAKDES